MSGLLKPKTAPVKPPAVIPDEQDPQAVRSRRRAASNVQSASQANRVAPRGNGGILGREYSAGLLGGGSQ